MNEGILFNVDKNCERLSDINRNSNEAKAVGKMPPLRTTGELLLTGKNQGVNARASMPTMGRGGLLAAALFNVENRTDNRMNIRIELITE